MDVSPEEPRNALNDNCEESDEIDVESDNKTDAETETVRPPKRRRKAGELSGRQMALKKLENEGSHNVPWQCRFPPPFREAVIAMRGCLVSFGPITQETASAMRIYATRKLGIASSVSLFCCFFFCLEFPKKTKAHKACK